jgi:DNA-binding transcriptional LysR family regulator
MLASHARRSQLEEERIVDQIHGPSASGCATIRIAASEGVAPDFLPQAFAYFRQTHPRAHF